MAHSSTTHDQLTDLDQICFSFWQHVTIFLLTLPHTIPILGENSTRAQGHNADQQLMLAIAFRLHQEPKSVYGV